MIKRILILVVFIPLVSFSQTTDWVKSFGGTKSDKGISIGVDSLGFIYISGYFNNNADFGSFNLVYNGSQGNNKDMFVAKLDSFGTVIWAISGGGGPYDDRALGMHVTPGGDVFLTGTFWGDITFPYNQTPNFTANGNGYDTSMLTKIDKDGNCVFARGFGANTGGPCPYPMYDGDDHSYDVKVDNDGFIYVTGFWSGDDADFDGFTLTNPNWNNSCQPAGYIAKLDAAGNFIWVDKFDGIKDQRGSRDNRLAIDEFSNIYVVGGFENTGSYGPFSVTSNGDWDAFLFKMDKDGNWIWAKNIGSNKSDRANSIAIDICNDIYITGEYRNPMVFPGANASNGTDTLSHKQKRDVFVAKMNNQGEWKWAKRARSEGTDKPYQMSVDANKQVFLGGTVRGEMTFSNGLVIGPQISGDTTASAWVAQLDGSTNTGDWVWAKMAGGDTDDDDRTGDICPDGFGNVYAIGFFEEVANFDGTVLTSLGKKDIFVWKMSMIPGSFTYNNTFDTVYTADSMVFSPADTGIFTSSGFFIDGCDTSFVDSVVHQKLGIQIIYNINNPGSATVTIDGVVQALPYSQNYWYNNTVNLSAQLSPNWLFNQWQSNSNPLLSNTSLVTSFNAVYSDSVILITYPKPPLTAFISGNDTICDNSTIKAEVKISFSAAVAPYTFVYSVNGQNKPPIVTTLNPYIITTDVEGIYDLVSFSDATEVGWFSGSALVTVSKSPQSLFSLISDTLSVIYPNAKFTDNSIMGDANISEWMWNFGDNTFLDYTQNPEHRFENQSAIFEISLIITDDLGCTDTTYKHIWITDEYWMYVPNSFTPDNDQINDVFCISYNGIRTETFLFTVYNRVSEVVFSTTNITEIECFLNDNGWDGKHQNTGNDLPMGMYVYEIYFQDFEGWKHQDFGNIYIIR